LETSGEAPVDAEAAVSPSVQTDTFTRVPALDGIRAIAVVAVLLFHHYQFDVPGSHAWAGGFLGVDVFFVLSGYLITTLLLYEHANAGRIDFRRFWSRRARRLLPALFVVVIATALLGRHAFDAASAANLRHEGFATLFYVENWSHLGVLGKSASGALSHTWSLSVEEQWYLVWPLLLAALLVWSRRRGHSLAWPIGFLVVVSATECALLFRGLGDRSYYGTDTRAQSLLIGAGLAVVLLQRGPRHSRTIAVAGCVAAAFLAVMFYVAHPVDAWMYRGGFLLVALATALIVAAVQQSDSRGLGRVLGARPLVAIGLISYGLYLYHYPIYLWLTASRTHLTASRLFLARLGLTALVAVASYFLIEQPFRRGRQLGRSRLGILITAGAVALVALVLPVGPGPPWTVAQAAPYAEAAANISHNRSRVLVAGDASAVSLMLARRDFHGRSIGAAAAGVYGCDVVAGGPIVFGKHLVTDPRCAELDRYFLEVTRAFRPKFSVLVMGPEDARARIIDGRTLRPRSRELQASILARLEQMRSALTTTNARFALLLTRCDRLGDVTPEQLAWLHDTARHWARSHPSDTLLSDDRLGRCIDNADLDAFWADISNALPLSKGAS
jgi:peptidoglycan/LPS O-acetylase OafA/YrhL